MLWTWQTGSILLCITMLSRTWWRGGVSPLPRPLDSHWRWSRSCCCSCSPLRSSEAEEIWSNEVENVICHFYYLSLFDVLVWARHSDSRGQDRRPSHQLGMEKRCECLEQKAIVKPILLWTSLLSLRVKCIVNFHDDVILVQFIRNILLQWFSIDSHSP